MALFWVSTVNAQLYTTHELKAHGCAHHMVPPIPPPPCYRGVSPSSPTVLPTTT